MKSVINELNIKNSKKDREASLKNEFAKALKNPDFEALLIKLKIKNDEAYKVTSKLENTVCELDNCKKCKGVFECKNRVKGCVYYPIKVDDRIDFNYIECKYKSKMKKKINNNTTVKYYDVPEVIKNASLSEIDITDKKRVEVIKWIKDFYDNYDNKNKGLYLHGNFGCGKTYLIAALFNELSTKGIDSLIIYYPEMVRSLNIFKEDFNDRMNMIKNSTLLLIDDIGAEKMTEYNRDEILGTILQHRMDNNLITFFTSNLDILELESHLATGKEKIDLVKSRRILERIKQLTYDMELISINRRI